MTISSSALIYGQRRLRLLYIQRSKWEIRKCTC